MIEKIGVVNFNNSNSLPLMKAFENLGYETILIEHPSSLLNVDRLVIPGVGHISAISQQIQREMFFSPMLQFIASGRLVLGICLGLHVLTENSEEDSAAPTMGVLRAKVKKLDSSNYFDAPIPHVGWNSVSFIDSHPLFQGIPSGADFFFSHSFGILKTDEQIIGETFHGQRIVSALSSQNIFGVQFHPEKSQVYGKRMLQNFAELPD